MALSITIVVGVIYYFVMGSDTADENIGFETQSSEAVLKTEKILADTKKIDGFKMDSSVLSDARFVSLQNSRVELPNDISTGRSNPFSLVQ